MHERFGGAKRSPAHANNLKCTLLATSAALMAPACTVSEYFFRNPIIHCE